MIINEFRNRLTEVLFYPKLCKYEDYLPNIPEFLQNIERNDFESEENLVVYIHIPFCNRFCFYCSYYKESVSKYDENAIRQYFVAICKELEMYSSFRYFVNKKVKAIQFGGGTPSLIEPHLLQMVIQKIKDNFDCTECTSITMEGNAVSLLENNKIERYKEIGIQRLSIGVQTFNEHLRKKLNIETTIGQIYEMTQQIKKAGYQDYSMDLMYNLPGETIDQIEMDIRLIDQLEPRYIDIYSLNIFPNTRLKQMIDKGNYFDGKPTDHNNNLMTERVINTFNSLGYNQVMAFTYSKKENNCPAHVDIFFNGGNVLGIGPSARSYLSGVNFRNITNIKSYLERVMQGAYPLECGIVVPDEEKNRKKMVFFPLYLKIRKSEIIDIDIYKDTIHALIKLGYLLEDKNFLYISQEGKKWIGNIATCFFSKEEKEKHNLSFMNSLKENENPYNQDKMWV